MTRRLLAGSIFLEAGIKDHRESPCLVYLHSHSGCQAEVSDLVRPAVEQGFAVCAFDYSGYGRSEGEFGTLGLRETGDVEAVLEHLSTKYNFRHFFLWGRSMGAATALRFAASTDGGKVRALVLDSPFADVRTMIKDMLAEAGVPRFVTAICLLPLAATVKDKTGVDVLDNAPIKAAADIQVPTVVIVADRDTVTRPERVREVFEAIPRRRL